MTALVSNLATTLVNALVNTNGPKTGPIAQKNQKNCRKTDKNLLFHKNLFFDNFKLNMGGLGVSGGMAWTMRTDSLEVWRDLVLHGMGEVDFHVLPKRTYEYNQLIVSISIFVFFDFPGTWTTSHKSFFFDKMASFFLCFFVFFVYLWAPVGRAL